MVSSAEEKLVLLSGLSNNCLACTLTEKSATCTDTEAIEIKIQINT